MNEEKPIVDDIKGVVAAYQPTKRNFKECSFNLEEKGYELKDEVGSGSYCSTVNIQLSNRRIVIRIR